MRMNAIKRVAYERRELRSTHFQIGIEKHGIRRPKAFVAVWFLWVSFIALT